MNQINDGENKVSVTGSSNGEGITFGSGSGGQQVGLGRHKVTAKLKWDKEINRIVVVLITMSMQSGLKSWRKKD